MESLTRREFLFFTAAGAAAVAAARVPPAAAAPPGSMFRTATGWDLPAVVIDRGAEGTGPGLIFAAPFATSGTAARGSSGPVIFDEDGNPVWFLPLDKVRAMNFKAQTYRGAPVLTWYESSGTGLYGGSCVVYGHDYREIKRVHGGHGYAVDLHEFVLTSRNTALLAIAGEVTVDGSRVVEGIVQEVQIESGKVLFEWHSLDHVPLDESYRTAVAADGTVDYFHLNSIGVAPDGDLIVSSRHTATVYKLDRKTGDVVWRLGGKRSDFTFAPEAQFWFQHDARMHADGTMSLFDNGATGPGPAAVEAATRPLRLHLDTSAMTAELVQVFVPRSPRFATAMGNLQLLPDGGAFVGWGTAGGFTEFAPDGSVRLDGRFGDKSISYRIFRLPWTGRPATKPSVVLQRDASGTTAFASWNGSTAVSFWELRTGLRAGALAQRVRVPRMGFETAIRTAANSGYVAVAALDASRSELGSTRPIPLQH
jgi:hypothetical protein